jgi:hypothetical protein
MKWRGDRDGVGRGSAGQGQRFAKAWAPRRLPARRHAPMLRRDAHARVGAHVGQAAPATRSAVGSTGAGKTTLDDSASTGRRAEHNRRTHSNWMKTQTSPRQGPGHLGRNTQAEAVFTTGRTNCGLDQSRSVSLTYSQFFSAAGWKPTACLQLKMFFAKPLATVSREP